MPLFHCSTRSGEKHSDHCSNPHPTSNTIKHVKVSTSANVGWAIKYQRVLAVGWATNDEVMASHHVRGHHHWGGRGEFQKCERLGTC